MTVNRRGSRISQSRDAKPKGGFNLLFGQSFRKTAWNLKNLRGGAGTRLKFVCVDPPLVKKRICSIRLCKINSCAFRRFTFASEKHIRHVADTKLPTSAFNTLQILDFDQSAPSMLFVCNAAHAIQSSRLLSQIDNRFFHYRPMWFGSITDKLFLIFQGADNVWFFFDTIDCDR